MAGGHRAPRQPLGVGHRCLPHPGPFNRIGEQIGDGRPEIADLRDESPRHVRDRRTPMSGDVGGDARRAAGAPLGE